MENFKERAFEMKKVWTALSDETRRKILSLLKQKEMTVGEIVDCFKITQPTISHQIQQLEEKYKTILIQRKNRQIELTEQGEVFLQYARKILLLDKQMEQELHQVNSPLSVHISHYIAEKYFATILPLHIDEFEQQSFSIKSNCNVFRI